MACTTETLPARTGGVAAGIRFVALVARAWEVYWERRADRATIAVLQSLSDYTLHDIGIDRSEIESVVRTKGYGRRWRD